MSYGYFSQTGDEYVITRPDTPRPWVNHLGHASYGIRVSQTGAGISLHGDRRIVNLLYHFMREDQPGRYVFVRDRDTGDFWSITWQPCRKDYDRFECRHGMAHTIISSSRSGIDGSVRYFVPMDEPVEIWTVTVRNASGKRRRLSLFPYCEWAQKLGPPHGDDLEYACFSDAAWSAAENMLIARYHESIKVYETYTSFMAGDFVPDAYETSFDRFVGAGLSRANPQVLRRGRCSSRDTNGDMIVGVLQKNLSLEPGATATLNVMIGLSDRRSERRRLARKFLEGGGAERAYERCREFWASFCGKVRVRTPDRKLDRMLNYWMKKQIYQRGVGTTIRTYRHGFRDTMQDAWSLLTLAPEVARTHIETAARYVWENGEAARAWTCKGEGDIVNVPKIDLKLWLIIAVAEYIKTTGDFGVLETASPYLQASSPRNVPLLDKLRRIADKAAGDIGPRGLSLIGGGDWNDALDAAGVGGRGESVWQSEAVAITLRELAVLCERVGDSRNAARYRRVADKLVRRINAAGWDGKWYLQGYDDEGQPIGSHRNREGVCYLMPQSWALLAGVAPPKRAASLMRQVRTALMTEYGPVVMLKPYRAYRAGIGRLSQLRPGMCENGAVWCHAVAFTVRALFSVGRATEALDLFHRVSPFNHDPAKTHAEPFVYSNMYRGRECGEDLRGRTFVAWKTSTGGCLYLAFLERMFGIQPDYDGLRINPCVPKSWPECSVTVSYRGATYAVTICNPSGVERGVRRLVVDGSPCRSRIIPWFADGQTHTAEVVMG